jgi:hypothetical protein
LRDKVTPGGTSIDPGFPWPPISKRNTAGRRVLGTNGRRAVGRPGCMRRTNSFRRLTQMGWIVQHSKLDSLMTGWGHNRRSPSTAHCPLSSTADMRQRQPWAAMCQQRTKRTAANSVLIGCPS